MQFSNPSNMQKSWISRPIQFSYKYIDYSTLGNYKPKHSLKQSEGMISMIIHSVLSKSRKQQQEQKKAKLDFAFFSFNWIHFYSSGASGSASWNSTTSER